MSAALASPCTCPECRELDRQYPGEGVQLRLIATSSGGAAGRSSPVTVPEAPAIPAAGVSAPESRPSRNDADRRRRARGPKTGDTRSMNQMTSIEKPARTGRLRKMPAAEVATKPMLVPSSPQLFPLKQLRRAPENVRHTRIDEDVAPLADDILAHGLLQSLIGYEQDGLVQIVGGGRRFQALRRIEDEGTIDGEFFVAVLIRDKDEAVELSLAENLQQRTMSPVDEFLAFRQLMDIGTNSPASLAARFGFTERVVKQRLRLAELAPEILDALAERNITIDAAMAYASSQDQALQRDVFKAQSKRSWDQHKPTNIRHDLRMKGIDTSDRMYRFVGAEIYERDGGGYEDDLFNEAGKERVLDKPFLLETAAQRMIDFQMLRVLEELKRDPAFAPTIVGYVKIPDLRLHTWGSDAKLPVPKGFALVDRYEHAGAWKTIRNNAIDVHVVVGLDDNGQLQASPRKVFVPKDQKTAVDPQSPSGYRPATPEEQAAARRKREVDTIARRMAVPAFAGTPFEGRAFWPEPWQDRQEATIVDGVDGWYVPVRIFVSDDQIAGFRAAAEEQYDTRLAAEEAAKRRADALRALDPPAVVVIDGQAWARAGDGSYSVLDDDDGFVGSWTALLANFDVDDVGDTFATREAFDAAMGVAAAAGDAA